MRAIILAGGIGKRMKPLRVEKPLLRFGRRTIIERLVSFLSKRVDEIVAITNPSNNEKLQQLVDETYVQTTPSGISDGLIDSGFLEGEVLIVNPNDIFEEWLLDKLMERDMAIAAKPVDSYFPGGYVIERNGMVDGIVEKPGEGREPSNLVKLLVDKVDGDLLRKYMERGEGGYEKALSRLARASNLEVVRYDGKWKAIKYPWHILDAMEMLLDGIVVEETARISPTARIEGNVYIGNGVFVGDYSLVRDSVLLDGVVVGAHTEVARSYIMEGTTLHRNYVGDSVIGRNVIVGANAVFANMRFDKKPIHGREKLGAIVGDSAKIGVNASIMPGSIIDAGEVIMPSRIKYASR